MRFRTIALAIPLIGLGACSTGSTQGSRTARTDRQGAEASGGAQANAGGASASADASTTAGTPSAHGNVSAPGAPDAAAGATAGGVETGSPSASADAGLKAHSDDRIVTGTIAKVSPESLTIAADDGDHLLKIVPQTTIQVDGQDADRTALSEGLPARASFSNVDGDDVAVQIDAGRIPSPSPAPDR